MARPQRHGVALSTLADYAAVYQLHAYCPACRHHAVLNPMQAAQVAGWDATLPELRAALRCSVCGHQGAVLLSFTRGGPGGGEAMPRAIPGPL